MTEFDLTRNPFSTAYTPKDNDEPVVTTITLNIRHYPTEDFLIREAVNDCNVRFKPIIKEVFELYKINRPKDQLLSL